MPTVPVYQSHTDSKSQPVAIEPAPEKIAESALSLRRQLADSVRKEVEQKGRVSESFLDNYAATHFDTTDTDTPLWQDYAMLRHTAVAESARAEQEQQTLALQEEADWISQVGALASDAGSFQVYLQAQLPAYRQRLKEKGYSPAQIQEKEDELCRRTVEQNLVRSLEVQDWQSAQQVFTRYKKVLAPALQERLAGQIRRSFAGAQANRLWQEGSKQGDVTTAEIAEWATAHIQEPDEELNQAIRQEITRLGETATRKTAAQQARVFAQLAQGDSETVQRVLNTQTVLEAESAAQARKVAERLQEPVSLKQQEWFVKNYLDIGNTDADKALRKGQCGARDYFRLQAAQLYEQSGQTQAESRWICRGLETWMKRQGFSSEDITRATYAVLSEAEDSTGRLEFCKRLKTLLVG